MHMLGDEGPEVVALLEFFADVVGEWVKQKTGIVEHVELVEVEVVFLATALHLLVNDAQKGRAAYHVDVALVIALFPTIFLRVEGVLHNLILVFV